jgi:Cd2+/Zn2+-exporting ATPase
MDCASCAATVEKRVAALPGVRRAAVNFAAGRLDAEHDPGLSVEEIERAVEGAGYRVARTEGAEVPSFWRTRRAALTGASAALFLIGLALSLAGTSQVPAMGAYAAAMLVGGLPIFRAAVAGLRARQLDMNLLMGAATIGAAGIGEIVMLTGDAEAPARRVAEAVGYTGRGCSRSRRSRRCAGWSRSTARRGW